jgi:hypothetical protein
MRDVKGDEAADQRAPALSSFIPEQPVTDGRVRLRLYGLLPRVGKPACNSFADWETGI